MKSMLHYLLNFFSSMSIRNKLIFICMVVGVLCILLVGISFIVNDSLTSRQAMQERMLAQAAIISANASAALMFSDRETSQELLQSMQADAAVLAAGIYQIDGRLFVDFAKKPDYLALLPKQLIATYQQQQSDRYLYIQIPITHDDEHFGHIAIISDDSDLNRRFAYVVKLFLLVGMMTLLISLLLANRLQRTISKPIASLTQLSRSVEKQGDYSLRSQFSRNDELGYLAQGLNSMLSQIEQRDRLLEQKVKQRTAELEQLNSKLHQQAFYDALTNLPNRVYFSDQFQHFTHATLPIA